MLLKTHGEYMTDTTFYATSYSPPRNGVSDDVPAVQSAVNAAAAAGCTASGMRSADFRRGYPR